MHLKIIFKIAETSIVQHEFINGISCAFKSRINVPRIIDRLIRLMSGTVSFRHRHNIKYIKLINMSDWHVYIQFKWLKHRYASSNRFIHKFNFHIHAQWFE